MEKEINPVVVVPIHKAFPERHEVFSLKRCQSLMSKYPITFVHPRSLCIAPYRSIVPSADYLPVEDGWMSSLISYNRMIINPAFYEKFLSYSHILLHEPDAVILSDQLLYWCRKGFDYIGAPWLEGFASSLASDRKKYIGVGNSGFSLIDVRSMMRALASEAVCSDRFKILKYYLRGLFLRSSGYSFRNRVETLFCFGDRVCDAHRFSTLGCDVFISRVLGDQLRLLRVASISDAAHFSLEVHPKTVYHEMGCVLPFGMHAWCKYDKQFAQFLIGIADSRPRGEC